MKEEYYFISHWAIHRMDLYYDPTESDMCYYVLWNLNNGLVEHDGFETISYIRDFLKYFRAKERKEDLL